MSPVARRPILSMPQIKRALKDSITGSFAIAIGRAFHKARPEHVRQIGACLIAWPELEMQIALLLSRLLKAEEKTTISVFMSLSRSTHRNEVIEIAAKSALNCDGQEYVTAALRVIQSAEAERNALAHATWGFSPLIEDGIICIPSEQSVHFNVSANGLIKAGKAVDFSSFFRSSYVYTMRDLGPVFS